MLVAACSDASPRRDPGTTAGTASLTVGEERARIAHPGQTATTMRSGPNVPVRMPSGFTVYPGAKVVSNTVVERGGKRRALLVFETVDPVAEVVTFYRTEARAARASLALDLGGDERASLGGTLAGGGEFAISVRQAGEGTRVEFSTN